jgi:hypothetical protein
MSSTTEKPVKEPVKGEHIFPATVIEPLAIQWKKLIAESRHDEASPILEDIVCKSSAMFSRLAQYEGFHHTVELESLVLAAQARVATWLLYWDPAKGRLFTWMSKCSKHVFLSEVVRASQHRKRYYPTSDNLEKFVGSTDHQVDVNEAIESVRDIIRELSCRWGDAQVICCIRFHVACIVENPGYNKKVVIRAGAYASGLSFDLSKFFHNWALYALRDAMYDKMNLPYTEQDLFRLVHSFTYLPDLLTVITWEQLLKIIALLGGTRVKFPTLAQLEQAKKDYKIFRRLERSNHDPDAVAEIAKDEHVSVPTAQELYERMVGELHDDRSGEFPIYG